MMNGRQRAGRGWSSHESGSTSRKKIAKVAVGKSTRLGSAAEAGQLLRLRWRQARRGPVVCRDVQHGVCVRSWRATTDRRAGRSAGPSFRTRARARASSCAAAAHSAAATRSQAPTITPAITGASRPAAAASAATATRKTISSRSHGTARPRARGVSTDRTQLGAFANNGPSFVPTGVLTVLRGEDTCLVAQRLHLGLEPFDLRRERADGSDELHRFLLIRLAGDLRRLGRVRHGRRLSPRRRASSRRAPHGLARAPRRAGLRPTPPRRARRPSRRRVTRRASA